MAAKVEIVEGSLHVAIEGLDRVLALRVHIEVPLANVRGARVDAEAGRRLFHGIRAKGTSIPGVVTAGSFYDPSRGTWTFFDVHDPDRAIVIDLDHEHFASLVLEVDDPRAAAAAVEAALGRPAAG
ncbi:MAG TPA: hypothetical protein VNN74_09850 [Candidatus Micrarchaeia archaeon]|nr:hypothetical protein [Candidatus Micrarchaeia archaeon]